MQARTEEYARLLRRFSKDELAEAYTDVVQAWTNQGWPPPGAFFTAAMENRKLYAVPEHRPLDAPPPKQLDLPHERAVAILDEHPTLTESSRRALYRLGAGVEPPWAEMHRERDARKG